MRHSNRYPTRWNADARRWEYDLRRMPREPAPEPSRQPLTCIHGNPTHDCRTCEAHGTAPKQYPEI